MKENKIFKIDIDKVLQDKVGTKAKYIPTFIRTWLKHIVHQEEINTFLESVGDIQGIPWIDAVMNFLEFHQIFVRCHLQIPPFSLNIVYEVGQTNKPQFRVLCILVFSQVVLFVVCKSLLN